MMIPGHDRRYSQIYVSGLALKPGTELPSGDEHGDHVSADDAIVRRHLT